MVPLHLQLVTLAHPGSLWLKGLAHEYGTWFSMEIPWENWMEWESCAQVLYIDVGTNGSKWWFLGPWNQVLGYFREVPLGDGWPKPEAEPRRMTIWAESLPLSASVSAARFEGLFWVIKNTWLLDTTRYYKLLQASRLVFLMSLWIINCFYVLPGIPRIFRMCRCRILWRHGCGAKTKKDRSKTLQFTIFGVTPEVH